MMTQHKIVAGSIRRAGVLTSVLLSMAAGAWARQGVTRMAAALEENAKVEVEAVLPLSGIAGTAAPLGFYQQIVIGGDGSLYLSAMSGGRYRPVPYRVYAFNSDGGFRAGLGPQSETTGVAFLLGILDADIYVVSRWLNSDAARRDAPWSLYTLSVQDLRVRSERTEVWPGMLVGDEIIASGLGGTAADRRDGNCVHVYGLDGALRRSMARCPEVVQPALNIVESGSDGKKIYWVHSNEGVVRVVSLAGEDGTSFGRRPAKFVSYADALAHALEGAAPDAPVPSRVELMDHITRVTRVLPVGDSLIVTYFLPPRDASRFWEYGSIVQIYDVATKALRSEFETPLRLLGADGQGKTYWLATITSDRDMVRHAIVRTSGPVGSMSEQ